MSSQYGEETILLDFLQGKPHGMLVDVGAADGVFYSNSRHLIEEYGWKGILIEPEPEQYQELRRLYAGSLRVIPINAAASLKEGVVSLWPAGMGSTTVPSWKARIEKDFPECKFGKPIDVRSAPLSMLLYEANCPDLINFLSIDCEGMDLEVLQSMNWDRYSVELLCVESGDDGNADDPLNHYLKSIGFTFHARTRGNTFWKPL